ncbi:unnamed protein product [Cladocopium goreaui]|uniref:Uncharacterized protein n=1 Tax=Cladocopium goreaui TaxID=2562237 RepID=A0A9P1CYA0_9DINO|nr:unnamed protein product [Cladocopium goreaui]
MALALSEEPRTRPALGGARKLTPRPIPKCEDFYPSCLDSDENRWGADLRSAVTRLEARMHALEGQNLRSDRRAAELAGLTQALTEEQRALLIRLDRLEDLKRRDALQVPEDRLGRLEQEHRTLALELRLTVSVAEEAQQKQQQRIRSLEESMGARLRKLEHGGGEMAAETDPSGRSLWPEVSQSRANDEAKDVSLVCDSLEAKLCGLTASVEEIQKQLVSVSRRCESPSLSVQVAEPGSPSLEKAGAMPFEEKLEQLEHFCLDLRETLEDRLLLVLADLEKQVPDLLQKFQRESEDGAERAEKLRELEVRVEMFCRRMSTQEERLQSCAERAEKSVALPQLRSLCREELQKKLSEEDLLGTTALVRKQQDALNEVQLQLQRLLDRLHLAGLRQAVLS